MIDPGDRSIVAELARLGVGELSVLKPDSPPHLSPALAHALVRLIANTGTQSLDSRHDGGLSSKVS